MPNAAVSRTSSYSSLEESESCARARGKGGVDGAGR